MRVLKLLLTTLLLTLYFGQVNSIGFIVKRQLYYLLNKVGRDMAKYVRHNVHFDHVARHEFMKRAMMKVVNKDARFNYVIARDDDWKKARKAGVIITKHQEVQAKLGIATFGYKLAAFNQRVFNRFERRGDWVAVGQWRHGESWADFTPPRSPPLNKLLKRCVQVFSPVRYKYLSKKHGVNQQYVNSNHPKRHAGFFLTRRHGREYLYNYVTKSYLQCGHQHFALKISRVSQNWSPECKRSNNCYSIKVYDTGAYYSARADGNLQCSRTRVSHAEVFIIEPCGLFQ